VVVHQSHESLKFSSEMLFSRMLAKNKVKL